MQFFELTHPDYESDRAFDFANPVRIYRDTVMPGLICSVCADTQGGAWSGSRRLYLPITDALLKRRLNRWPLPETEWKVLAQAVREHVGLTDDFVLEPGDILGAPRATLLRTELPDFIYGYPGEIIVNEAVVEALRDAGLTGFEIMHIETHWGAKVKESVSELPQLSILVIAGHVWREDVTLETVTACKQCGRRVFPDWRPITEAAWTHTDFFNIDLNPNMVVVTECVCEVLARHHFTNYRCRLLA